MPPLADLDVDWKYAALRYLTCTGQLEHALRFVQATIVPQPGIGEPFRAHQHAGLAWADMVEPIPGRGLRVLKAGMVHEVNFHPDMSGATLARALFRRGLYGLGCAMPEYNGELLRSDVTLRELGIGGGDLIVVPASSEQLLYVCQGNRLHKMSYVPDMSGHDLVRALTEGEGLLYQGPPWSHHGPLAMNLDLASQGIHAGMLLFA